MMRRILCLIGFLVFIFGAWYIYADRTPQYATITIDGTSFRVEVARTPEQRARGLQDRDMLGEREGMLFVFDEPDIYTFWMKHVRFPLDIIWIRDGKIVYFTRSADVPAYDTAEEQLTRYQSPVAVDRVLEVPAGTIDDLRWYVGDTVLYK